MEIQINVSAGFTKEGLRHFGIFASFFFSFVNAFSKFRYFEFYFV